MNDDVTLIALRRLSTRACDEMARPAKREAIEQAFTELDALFSELGARIPRGEHVPIDELAALLARQREVVDSLPFALAHGSRKYVPEAKRVWLWSEIVSAFEGRLENLRYAVLRAKCSTACDCPVLVELGTNARKRSRRSCAASVTTGMAITMQRPTCATSAVRAGRMPPRTPNLSTSSGGSRSRRRGRLRSHPAEVRIAISARPSCTRAIARTRVWAARALST